MKILVSFTRFRDFSGGTKLVKLRDETGSNGVTSAVNVDAYLNPDFVKRAWEISFKTTLPSDTEVIYK